jgi:hypothetical protein
MSRAREAAARIRQQEPPPRPVDVQARPVRRTVDLSPVQHHALAQWCAESAVDLERARITSQDVLASLVRLLLNDAVVAQKVLDDLRDDSRKLG